MSAAEWALLLALSLIWGGSFFFNEVLLREVQPLTIVLGRVGLAALALLALVHAGGQRLPRAPRAWASFAAMSLLNNLLPFALVLWGQTRIGSGLAAILTATTPLFTAVLAHLAMSGERLTAPKAAGVVLGLAGVVWMIGPGTLTAGPEGDALAQFAVLGAALSYALAALYGRRFAAMGIAPTAAAAGQLTASTIVMLPLALLVEQPWSAPAPGLASWLALLGLALISTALAYVIFFRLLSGAGALNTALVTMLVPVSAVLLGTIVLGEAFTLHQASGMAVILLGLAVTDGRAIGYAFRRPSPGRAP